MNDVQVLGVINGESEDEVIEVVLRGEEQKPGVQLRARRWGSGIGWYTQKTLEISPDQIDRLMQTLRRVSGRSENPPSANVPRSVVVPFGRKYGA